MDVLFPRTDGDVVVQAALVLTLLVVGLWATRRRPDARLVVIGVGLVFVGLFGLRAVH